MVSAAARRWTPTWASRLERVQASDLVRASAQTIAAGIAAQGLLLVSGALTARMLGVEGRGALAMLTIWPLIVTLLGNLGVPVACTYHLRARASVAAEIWGECLRMALAQCAVLTLVVVGILWLASATEAAPMSWEIGLAALMVAPMLLHRYGLAVLQGRERYVAYNVLRTLPTAIYAGAVVVLFASAAGASVEAVVAANVAAYTIACAVTLRCVQKELRPRWGRVPGLRRGLLGFGLRGHLGAVAPVDGLRLDQAVVAVVLDARAMGLYAAAYAFTNLPRFIADSASRVALPAVADRAGRVAQLQLVWRFFWGVTALVVPVTTTILLAMPLLVRVCFGEAFADVVPIARTLLVGTTFVACRRILVEGLRGLGEPTASTLAELSMYPWLVLVAPFLMTRWGVQGLAFALTSGYALSLLVAVASSVRRAPTGGGCPA